MNLLWTILKNALLHPRRIAAVDDRRTYRYLDLVGGALFLARQIERQTPCPRIGLMLPTSGAFPLALLGTWLAGRTAVPLNYLLSPEELTHVIEDAELDFVITAGPLLEHIDRRQLPETLEWLEIEKLETGGLPPLRLPPRPGSESLAVLLYTSGTSGRPKGVMLTHGNLEANIRGAAACAGIRQARTFLGVLPQFHSFGLTGLTLLPLALGARTIYTARFVPRRLIKLIQEHRPEVFMAIPSMYGAMLGVKQAEPDALASLRFPVSGGEALPAATFEAFETRFGIRILEGYGLTETGPILSWSTPEHFRRSSVGRPLANVRILVVDDTDRPVPCGEEGEILAAGPNVMAGYYNLPEETGAVLAFLPDPAAEAPAGDEGPPLRRFFRTGDMGRLDEEGYLYVTGRKKEMLIIGGENVYPREIEEVLNRHASVAASGVVGRQDSTRGEVPVAYVELAEGADFDDQALRQHCREHLAGYKVPREIHLLESLPRNASGKVLRRKLKSLCDASPT